MLRIDFYAQHLLRHRAQGVDLISGEPVCFQFASGPRRSNTPIEHRQIKQLVEEAAPAQVLADFRRLGSVDFEHSTPDGTRIHVSLSSDDDSTWKVVLEPANGKQASPPRPPSGAQTPESTTMRFREGSGSDSGISTAVSFDRDPKRSTDPGFSEVTNLRNDKTQVARAYGGGGHENRSEQNPFEDVPTDVFDTKTGETKTKVRTAQAKSGNDASSLETGVALETASREITTELQPGEPRINGMLRELVKLEGSDLHLSSTVAPMLRLHGEMSMLPRREVLSNEELHSLLWEIMPERNRAEFEESNDTDFAHTIEGLARFRANVFRDRHGIGGVFRQIPFQILSPEQLGLPKQVLDLCWLSKGLVVVTGPTGSGKSTTLATLIDYINRHRRDHIITIEDPIEFVHQNKKCLVNQREIGTHTTSFKNALRAALREDPDIVLVGEMRDLETISIAIETAETGHLVFGTLHTTTAPSTVDRIIDQFPADQQAQIRVMLSESIRGVIAQVLCKKQGGGRVAGYEILVANAAVSNLIREGKTYQLTSVMQTGRKLGMQTMNDHLVQHVLEGRVSAEEAYIKCNNKIQMRDLFNQNGIEVNLDALGE